jgi:hypothetical protein
MSGTDRAEGDELSTDARWADGEMPEELRYLPERGRAQELALQRKFAEQEHGLR